MKKGLVAAIIGMGEHMLRAHVPYILKEGVVISRYFDPKVKKSDLMEFFNDDIPVKSTLQEIYNDKAIDVVFIGSPDKYHPEQFFDSVNAGKHVFIEKPLAIGYEGMNIVNNALRIAKEKGLIISSCHPRRFDPPIVELKKLIHEKDGIISDMVGDFSKAQIQKFEFSFLYHKVTDEWKKDRSLLLDHFGHEIDLLRFMFDWLSPDIFISGKKISDSYARYEAEGRIGIIDGNFVDYLFTGERVLEESQYKEFIKIRGSKGSLLLNINSGVLFVQNKLGEAKEIQLSKKSYECMFAPVNKDFIDAILNKKDPYLTHDDLRVNNSSGIFLKEDGGFTVSATN